MHDWKERRAAGQSAWEEWYQAKLAEIVRVVESEESRRFAGEIETLSRHLKPISPDSRIASLLQKSFVGRTWLMEAVDEWCRSDDRSSRLFWIVGDPGVGKSAFAAHLTHFGRDKVIAAQFVEWDKPDHRNARRVVRSLAFQLATRLPDYRKLLLALPEIVELEHKDSAELFDYLLANPLRSVIGGGRERHLIVIDALDEAGEPDCNPLAEMLAQNAQRLPDWLGLVVTSRPESAVQTPLQGLNPFVLDTGTEANRADLRDYLRHKLAPQLQDRPDADRFIGQILEKSEGVFLYAERFCYDVQRGHLSLDHPEQFPLGLGGVYLQWFQRQFPDLNKFRTDARPALRAIIAAREPLPVKILRHLFNWQDEELCDFGRTLGSLFPATTELARKVIKPFHKSLTDWLTDDGKAGSFFVSAAEGHRMLTEAGAAQFRSAREMDDYYWEHLLEHILRSESWDEAEFLLSDEHFLGKCSGSIREFLPLILSRWPEARSSANLTGVPDKYVQMCRAKQACDFVPDGLIPSNALGTIMRRPNGKLRDADEFVASVKWILTMFSRAMELATAMAGDPRFGPAHLSRMMRESGVFRRMADAVWERDLEERSGTLANLSNFVKRDWDRALEFLDSAGVPLNHDAS